jgi:hypothetical protein
MKNNVIHMHVIGGPYVHESTQDQVLYRSCDKQLCSSIARDRVSSLQGYHAAENMVCTLFHGNRMLPAGP